jgi:enoyl-CoA hydratase/carnithine racemase
MSVEVDVDGAVALITLNRPEKLNAMDGATYAALDAAFERIDEDPEIHAAVLIGAGDRAFSAGADLERMHGPDSTPKGWGTWKPDSWGFGRVPRTPLIAAIHGYALAGGLELALTCDIRISTPEGQFGAPEVKWALLHGLGASRLPAVVGLSNAMSLLLTADFIDADEALRIGLVSKIVPRDALLDTAMAMARKIAGNHPTAVQMTKELALRAAYPNAEEVARLYRSYFAILEAAPDQPGAIRKFSERERDGD